MRKKEDTVYTKLNKKKRRQRSRKKRKDHVETILQSGRGLMHIYKGGPKKKLCEMQNEENQVQTDIILKICARFFTELYSSTLQDQHPSLKNTSPGSSEVPPIMTSEVKKTLKEMRTNKATGIDNLTSDVVILGGEESGKQITK